MNVTAKFRPVNRKGKTQTVNLLISDGYEVDRVILPPEIEPRDEFTFEIPDDLVGVPLIFGLKIKLKKSK